MPKIDRMRDAPLRAEIWSAAGRYFEDAHWDTAVFEALKAVETELQRRVGSQSIGDVLVDEAFGSSTRPPRVRISDETRDQGRLRELFAGSIGFFKGDRSHGIAAVPCRSDADCLRMLAVASSLLDILDRDRSVAPLIQALRQEDVDVVELAIERSSAGVAVLMGGLDLEILSQQEGTVRVRLPGPLTGSHQFVVRDRHGRESASFAKELWDSLPEEHWHRVIEGNVPLFANEICSEPRSEIGVLLVSHEGERMMERVFPTRTKYSPGSYVSWEWDVGGDSVAESWARTSAGVLYAFTSSSFFAGVESRPHHSPRLVDIELRPRIVLARPGESVPCSVIGYHSDGLGRWRSDETLNAELVSSDEKVAHVDQRGAIRAKSGGIVEVRAYEDNHFARASINVASHEVGVASEYVGGFLSPVHLSWSPMGLLITNQSDVVRVVTNHPEVQLLARVDIPGGFPGLDEIAADGHGNVYLRYLRTNSVYRLDAKSGHAKSRSISFDREAGSVSALAVADDGRLFVSDANGQLWTWDESELDPQPFVTLDSIRPVHMEVRGPDVWVLGGQSGRGLVSVNVNTGAISGNWLEGTDVSGPSSFAFTQDSIVFSEFYTGRLVALREGTTRVVADSLDTPSCVEVGPDDVIYVSCFGSDSVIRILS